MCENVDCIYLTRDKFEWQVSGYRLLSVTVLLGAACHSSQ